MNGSSNSGGDTATTAIITQDYYDEVCAENVEVFGLSETESIQETEVQLQNQSSSPLSTITNKGSHATQDHATALFGHLSRTFPASEEGIQERSEIEGFKSDLSSFLDVDDGNDSVALALQRISDRVQEKPVLYLSVLHISKGFSSLVELSTRLWTEWMALPMTDSDASQDRKLESVCEQSMTTIKTLIQEIQKLSSKSVPVFRKRDWMVAFHQSVAAASWKYQNRSATASITNVSPLDTWLNALARQTIAKKGHNSNSNDWNGSIVQDLLLLIYHAVKNFEANKQYFMQAQIQQQPQNGDLQPVSYKLLMNMLDSIIVSSSEGSQMDMNRRLTRSTCRLIACLCTFEPDLIESTPDEGAPPMVSSAHANVMCFHQEEFVFKLHQLIQKLYPKTSDRNNQASTDDAALVNSYVVLALRAMAINNEIVQAVVAVGLLKEARNTLWHVASLSDNDTSENSKEPEGEAGKPKGHDDRIQTLVAVVGLFRNVCANDEVKTSLCIGKEQSIVEPMLVVMNKYPEQASLQEHCCGTMAAMALRKPQNAQFLVQEHQAHLSVLKAMQLHPNRAALQRQGALCLRNLVSRSPQLKAVLVDQAQAGQVLLQIAAQHVSCQDEVYAALRDLGVEGVGIMNVRHDEGTGQVTVEKTQMFGEGLETESVTMSGGSSFRPVYD
mmetsp:Transcript_13947/g.30492  ORF Transcript_13947/g.30492 Transcript_13947/m.30492 type:complete len:670 (-) Transcript_13947:38-2047(-)